MPRPGSRPSGDSCRTTSGRRASRGGRRSCGRRRCSGRMPRLGSSRGAQAADQGAVYRRLLDRFPARLRGGVPGYHPQVVRTWHSGLDSSRPTQRAHLQPVALDSVDSGHRRDLASNPCRVRGAGSAKRVRSIEPATLAELEVLLERSLRRIAPWCSSARGVASGSVRSRNFVARTLISRPRPSTSSAESSRIGKEVTVGKPKNIAGSGTSRCLHTCCRSSSSISGACRAQVGSAALPSVKDPDVQVHTNTLRRHWLKAGWPLDARPARARPAAYRSRSRGTVGRDSCRTHGEDRALHSADGVALSTRCAGRDAEIAALMSKEAKKWAKPVKVVGARLTPFRRYASVPQ